MIPVKNSAGGAAFVFHNEPERTPDEHANKIAHIKEKPCMLRWKPTQCVCAKILNLFFPLLGENDWKKAFVSLRGFCF